MLEALKEAKIAYNENEVPIGCVIVLDDKIIGRGHNTRCRDKNAILHAEINAINMACEKLQDWRLDKADLYVTLEPCVMCAGACFNARVKRVIFGANDIKGGAFGGLIDLSNKNILNHKLIVVKGVCENECSDLISKFFKTKRRNNK